MSNYYKFKPSLNDSAQYQAAPRPFVVSGSIPASTTIEVEFPAVTKWFSVNKWGGLLYFHEDAPNENKITFKGLAPITFDLKCRKLYLQNGSPTTTQDYEIIAGLTGIQEPYELTGSGITDP